uniref:Reverse transcriptase Ty1/copia-type domain-containing protein n=1 Tax=Tanacetum cinerariifolium TaxID=118510 RepID=A0A6L2K423_TANCI|nr:hypothetical protein [Tanacetum cinerariifolium]
MGAFGFVVNCYKGAFGSAFNSSPTGVFGLLFNSRTWVFGFAVNSHKGAFGTAVPIMGICLLAWMGRSVDIEGCGLGELYTYNKMFSKKLSHVVAYLETSFPKVYWDLEKAYDHEYILLPFMPSNSLLSLSTQSSDDKDANEVPCKGDEGVSKGSRFDDQERNDSSTQNVNTIGMPTLEEIGIFNDVYADREVGAKADTNNLELSTVVSLIPTTRVHKDHHKEQIIRDLNLAPQTRRMINFSKENAMVSYINKQRRTNHKDYQNCLLACFLSQIEPKKVIQALTDLSWIEAMQENKKAKRGIVVRNKARLVAQGYTQEKDIDYDEVFASVARIEAIRFRRGTIDKTLFIKKDRGDMLLVQVYVDDIIFGYTKKSLCDEFEHMMHKRFQMSSMGELTFFLGLQTSSTPMEPNMALINDAKAEDIDVNLYRLMIGSLMYLTASRPDIMFAVCACARFQVTPKTSHLYAMKRIFRYLKSQPKLALWYPRDLLFDLEVKKSSMDGFGEISADVKTVNEDVRLQALVDGKNVIVKEESIRRDLRLDDAEGTACLPNVAIFEELASIGKHKSRRKQRKEIEISQDELPTEEHIPTLSHDLLPSGEDRLQLNELMEICTKLSNRVLSLEQIKTNQAAKIEKLKKRVKKLEGMKKKTTHGIKRLYKVGLSARVESSKEEEGLCDQEDASKQGRSIADIDQDEATTLVDDTQGRMKDKYIFGVNDLDGDEVVVDVSARKKEEQSEKVAEKEVSITDPVTTASEVVTTADVEVSATLTTTTTTDDELTLAQILIKIKAAKPKAITTTTTTVTTINTRPKEKGIIMQEPSKTPSPKPIVSS